MANQCMAHHMDQPDLKLGQPMCTFVLTMVHMHIQHAKGGQSCHAWHIGVHGTDSMEHAFNLCLL